tara:strand:+ start:151 stop:387 length:237 start_codon:yes stop_codon:yes gene_type:complete
MFSPFKLVTEIISVGFQIVFLYGLAIILSIAFIAYMILSTTPRDKNVYTKPATSNSTKEVCYAIAGCKVNPDTGRLIK